MKCDERRPSCGQCARLGHGCDYSPRLTFRDDTARVVERMTEVSTTGNAVWDCTFAFKYISVLILCADQSS